MSAWVALPIISDPIIPPPPTDFRASRSRLPPASPKASKAPPAAKRPSAARRVMPVTEPSVQPLMLDDYRLIVAMEPIADCASRMAVPSAPKVREPKEIELLHLPTHLVQAPSPHTLSSTSAASISALAFSGGIDLRSRTFIALHVLLVLVAAAAQWKIQRRGRSSETLELWLRRGRFCAARARPTRRWAEFPGPVQSCDDSKRDKSQGDRLDCDRQASEPDRGIAGKAGRPTVPCLQPAWEIGALSGVGNHQGEDPDGEKHDCGNAVGPPQRPSPNSDASCS